MTPYDVAMVGVIVAGMVWGAFKGITWQLASIASLVLGYTAAHPLSGHLAPHLPGEPVVARGTAMLLVYVGTSGGVFFAAWLVRAILRRLQFEAYDRHLGMILGGLEGSLLGLVATLFVVSIAPQTREPIFNSRSGKVVGQVMSTLGPVLPEEARGVLAPFWAGSAPDADTRPAAQAPSRVAEAPRSLPAPKALGNAGRPQRDSDTKSASFSDLLDDSERKIGKAVIDGATESLRRAARGGQTNGTVERR